MSEQTPQNGPSLPATPLIPARKYEVDGKDRILLPLAWLLGILLVELVSWFFGLVVPVLVVAWYAVLIWYRGPEGLGTKTNLFLLLSVFALAFTFGIFSNPWFRLWNLMALPVLMAVQFWQWTGGARKKWYEPSVLWDSFVLTMDGIFCRLGAPFKAAVSFTGNKRWVYVLCGVGVAVPVLLLVCPLLISADALFAQVTYGAVEFLQQHFAAWMVKLLVGLGLAPFLFGMLYALRRPEQRKGKPVALPVADAALPVTVLGILDALYLFFIAVQFAGLFGGEQYLTAAGLSYAGYARSGFFQLVTVSVLNLTLVMAALQFSKREGRAWRGVQLLSTVLVAVSCVMLVSAAWKMTLYVAVYGLSFKRFLTYWGMLMLAVFFAAALMKIWRKEFSFFKVLFAVGLAGWLLLNFINVDYWVARYNVALYQSESSVAVDLDYLANLSYDTLGVLEALPGDTLVYDGGDLTLSQLIADRRTSAAWAASRWQTWSVSAQLAALR